METPPLSLHALDLIDRRVCDLESRFPDELAARDSALAFGPRGAETKRNNAWYRPTQRTWANRCGLRTNRKGSLSKVSRCKGRFFFHVKNACRLVLKRSHGGQDLTLHRTPSMLRKAHCRGNGRGHRSLSVAIAVDDGLLDHQWRKVSRKNSQIG